MKIRAISFMNLVFFMPAIILSWFVWNDYRGYLTNIDDHLPSFTGVYMLDNGKKVLGLSEENNWDYYRARVFDTETGTLMKETTIRRNIHGKLDVVSYQQGGVIVPTYDDSSGLQLNYFLPSGENEELAQGTIQDPNYLSTGVYSWRGRLIVTGETQNTVLYLALIEGGKLDTVLLNDPDLLPARPVRVSEVHGSFENDKAVPVFEVDLKDDRTAYVSGIFGQNKRPLVIMQDADETPFAAQDRASAQFAKPFGIDNAKLIRTDGDYPGLARFYDANEGQWGDAVPTPKPVYQSRIFLLNDEEVLIAGSTAEDELNGSVLGYIFNEKTGEFADATGLLGKLSYEELVKNETRFFKDTGSEVLFYVGGDEKTGSLNLISQKSMLLSNDQVKKWMISEGEDRLSVHSFWNYVKEGGALIINWLVWVLIPVVTFTGVALLPRLLMGSRRKKIAEGLHLPGTIVNMEQTGVYVNNLPQVRFVVRFEDEGQIKEVSIKKVISFLDGANIGDQVMISYNREKNRAVFLGQEDLQNNNQRIPEVIRGAVLTRIENHGKVNRGQALLLHFSANGREYSVPVVQPSGFEYRVGENASLASMQGTVSLFSYGEGNGFEHAEQISLQGEVIRVEELPITIGNGQLKILEVIVSEGHERIRKINSLFVPKSLPVKAGVVIPIVMRKDDYLKEARLHKAKQGAAKVTSVRYAGTYGSRPLAEITAERGGISYRIYQTIEPVYGVEVGDDLWIAYDETSREAVIINYSSM
ncbi:hypothetical protein [Paenibacillus sp. DYY-L-2]|uniref:hypothetical protein n=1 Tax=Paenibacillus sp. DYY-L-2 TaxID=3447013 RepID=UPI003F4F4197